jgi:hypothetical protein
MVRFSNLPAPRTLYSYSFSGIPSYTNKNNDHTREITRANLLLKLRSLHVLVFYKCGIIWSLLLILIKL